jgi:hypothetical protein
MRWNKHGSEAAVGCTVFCGKVVDDHHLKTGFFVHQGIGLAVKMVEFVSNRMSYTILRGHWCDSLLIIGCHIRF